jgi:hypothetical protein
MRVGGMGRHGAFSVAAGRHAIACFSGDDEANGEAPERCGGDGGATSRGRQATKACVHQLALSPPPHLALTGGMGRGDLHVPCYTCAQAGVDYLTDLILKIAIGLGVKQDISMDFL